MTDRSRILHDVMRETRTSQSGLSRLSGIHQPSISQFLSGTVDLSDHQLNRLLSCMGHQLEVTRRSFEPELTRSERRSWQLHRQLSGKLSRSTLDEWQPTVSRNLLRLGERVSGQPHVRNLERWRQILDEGDIPGLHKTLTGLDRNSIEMREVSPLSGLLTQSERNEILRLSG